MNRIKKKEYGVLLFLNGFPLIHRLVSFDLHKHRGIHSPIRRYNVTQFCSNRVG